MADSDQTLDDILAQTAWLRRLARQLVADEAARDDVVQEAWVQALRTGPRRQATRSWMFGVLRNVARMRVRGDQRRLRREAAEPQTAAPPANPEELVERVEVERRVAAELLQIDEPYRSTLLMRYYEELEPKQIAQRLGIPAGTVRWRLKEGLDQLRVRLDREFGGDRRRWGLALVPTAAVAHGRGGGVAASAGAALAWKLVGSALCVVVLASMVPHLLRAPSDPRDVARLSPGTRWRAVVGRDVLGGTPATLAGVSIPPWFGQPLAPVRRIAGRVTFAGAPLGGATVELASALSDAGVLPVLTQRTNRDGDFDFGTQPPARYSIAASAPHHSPAVLALDARDPTATTDHTELRLGGCDVALFGHVDDSSGGGPVVGAHVCYAPPRLACVASDDNGSYEICLGPQQPAVEVAAKGYGVVDERVYFSGRRTQRDFRLTPEATVIGRVVRAEDGRAIAGAQIAAIGVGRSGPRWPASAATVSDADGRFMLGGLSPGRVRVSAAAAGAAATEWIELNAEAGRVTGEALIRLMSAVSDVSGVVTDGEAPIAGAVVAIGDDGPLRSDAVTQRDGSFVLQNVPRGTEDVRVVGYDVREPSSLIVDRDHIGDVRVVAAPMASIAGRVTRAGQPVAHAEVSTGLDTLTLADDDGRYVLRGLPPGDYHLYATIPESGAFGLSPNLTLAAGEQRAAVDIDVQWASSISGTIVETSGKPAAGVFVRFEAQHRPDGGGDVTAPDGSFRVATLMGGDDYRPFVRPSPRAPQQLLAGDGEFPTVHVADGDSHVTGVRLVIKRAHLSIAGRAVDDAGQPLADVRVSATRIDGDDAAIASLWADPPGALSQSDGTFRIDNLDSGLYRLDARGGDGSETVVASVPAGAGGTIVELAPAGGIDGTLVGFASRPSVRAWRQHVAFATASLANGSDTAFSLRGLSAGEYVVSAVGGGGGDAVTVTVEPGRTASVTLHNRGVATIQGRVVDWRSGAPVAGLRCVSGVRSTTGAPSWDTSNVAVSDGDGRFTLAGVAAGASAVECKADNIVVAPGMASLTSTDGQVADVEVPVLEHTQKQSPGLFGAQLDQLAFLVARIIFVQPRSPADKAGLRAGDVIASVDGKPVTALTPESVVMLICDRGPGAEARLGIVRNGAASTVAVVLGPAIAY